MQPLSILHEDEFLRVATTAQTAKSYGKVLLSFTGVGHVMGGIDLQQPEFFGAGRGYDSVIFVSDLTRSWGNALDFDRLSAIVLEQAAGRRIDAIGNSMGGFLALLAPNFLPIATVIAFAPQFSVHPDIVPWDNRWADYRKSIPEWRYPSLAGHLSGATMRYVLGTVEGMDGRHMALFPRQDGLRLILLGGVDHNVALALKEADILRDLIHRCMDGNFDIDWLADILPPGITLITENSPSDTPAIGTSAFAGKGGLRRFWAATSRKVFG